ncbi:MAG TPA: serine dehydratase subunit alpha family protein [Mogibacterium sp.]|nr:serine dehydratase subunit alpha family protein [Mogibacterium sp.]
MHELTTLIKDDMKPALGVTEPGAIAFAVASARKHVSGDLINVHVSMNSGMYKNAFTCGIPNSDEVGNIYSAALGYVAGNADAGLEALKDVTEKDNKEADELVKQGKITVSLSEITSRIFIKATVETTEGKASVTIRDSHTNITGIVVDDKIIFDTDAELKEDSESNSNEETKEIVTKSIKDIANEDSHLIHKYTLAELVEYVNSVDVEDIEFVKEAYKVNLELFHAGLSSSKTSFGKRLLERNGGQVISDDEQMTASLLCNATIEARVVGIEKPAMSITGSGAHGIIATMPLYAAFRIQEYSEEQLYRATMLSYLVCTYIKEYSGKLSAFCGCAIAAGSGMACGLVYLRGGDIEMMSYALNNMASSITGMICDGGNHGCTMKGVAAVDAAYRSVDFAMNGIYIDNAHGINGRTPEETMRNMGLIASPGMVGTEKTIVEIFESKLQ